MTLAIADCRRAAQVYFSVTKEDIIGPSHKRRVAWPRFIAMDLARMYAGASFNMIGRKFGGRDHTTVLHATRALKGSQPWARRYIVAHEDIALTLAVYAAQLEERKLPWTA
jgi:chromosomal replication initiation ATPase DnaA